MSYDWKGEDTARRHELKVAASVALFAVIIIALVPLVI